MHDEVDSSSFAGSFFGFAPVVSSSARPDDDDLFDVSPRGPSAASKKTISAAKPQAERHAPTSRTLADRKYSSGSDNDSDGGFAPPSSPVARKKPASSKSKPGSSSAKPKEAAKSASVASSQSPASKRGKSPKELLETILRAIGGPVYALEAALDALEAKDSALRSAIHKEMGDLAEKFKKKSDPKWGRIVFLGKKGIETLCTASKEQLDDFRQKAVRKVLARLQK